MDRYLSVSELSEAYGIPRRTVYDAIKRGDIAVFVPNGCVRGYRVRVDEFERWCRDCERRG